MDTPRLSAIEQVSDGWIKKYVLTYDMPDGTTHSYEVASRKSLEAFHAHLEANGARCRQYMTANMREAETEQLAGAARAANELSTTGTANGLTTGEAANPDAPTFSNTPDAVCIVARTPRDSLVMIREFRYPLNSWCIAFPAGLVDVGEDPAKCACRELEEETGYVVDDESAVRLLPQAGYSSTGMSDETVLVAFAQAERMRDAHTEPHELIEVFELPIADIRTFLGANALPIGTRAQLILEIFAQREPLDS